MHKTFKQYVKAKDGIISYINTNNLADGDKIPSIRDFARDFQISQLTVQKAVSNLITQGYLTAKVGSGTYVSLKGKKSSENRTIGILMPSFQTKNTFLNEIVNGINDVLRQQNYRALLIQRGPGNIEEEEIAMVHDMARQNVRGIIADFTSPLNSILWSKLKHENIPFVCVNNLDLKHMFHGVSINNFSGGMMAAEALCNCGHQNIAIIANNIETQSVSERINGFENYLLPMGIKVRPEHFLRVQSDFTIPQDIKGFVDRICEEKRPPSAVFAVNDGLAAEFVMAAQNKGIKLPDEISIIGFDDSEICRYLTPQLTSIKQPGYYMGQRSAKLILSIIENPDTPEVMEINLKPELIMRNSIRKI